VATPNTDELQYSPSTVLDTDNTLVEKKYGIKSQDARKKKYNAVLILAVTITTMLNSSKIN
jgi:hypothetical protein